MPRATWRTNGLVVLVAVLGMVFGAAGPAAAVEAAAGAGTGWEYIGDPVGPCGLPTAGFEFEGDYFELDHFSTYDAVDPVGITIASYVGPTQIQITTEAVVQAPQGAAPAPCPSPPLVLVPLPVEVTDVYITGTSTSLDPLGHMVTGEVECTGPVALGLPAENFYLRIQSAVVFEFAVDCDITGNVIPGSVENERLVHAVEGTQTPCQIPIVQPFPPLPIDTYVDNPECVALGGGEGGQGSSHLVTTFEAAGT